MNGQLVSAALLGVVRRPPDLSELSGDVASAAAGLDGDPAEVLLRAAALDAASDDAGTRLVGATRLTPAPPDDASAVGPGATTRLEGMLAGLDRDLLAEWLRTVASLDRRAPLHLLPAVLDLGAREPSLRPWVTTVVGARGRWLAAQDPRWRSAVLDPGPATEPVSVDDETAWTHGDHPTRLAWLRTCRAVDADRGRQALIATWPHESVPHRVALARSLTPVPADEPFLEQLLDDRSAAVAQVGAELLATLATSALHRAVTDYAAQRVVVHRSFRRARLELRTDPPVDPRTRMALQALGQHQHARHGDLGWLLAAVAWTPLPAWTHLTGLSPEQLTAAELGDRPRSLLHRAWADAALRQRNPQWARVLGPTQPRLVAVLEPAQRDDVLVEVVGTGPPAVVLDAVAGAAELTEPVVRAIAERVVADPTVTAWIGPALRQVTTVGAVDAVTAVDSAAARLTAHDPRRRMLRRVAQVLTDRREMLEEIR